MQGFFLRWWSNFPILIPVLEADRVPLTVLSSWEKFSRWESSRNLKTFSLLSFHLVVSPPVVSVRSIDSGGKHIRKAQTWWLKSKVEKCGDTGSIGWGWGAVGHTRRDNSSSVMLSWCETGQTVDGPQYGMSPAPWDIPVSLPQRYTDKVEKIRVPHSSFVKVRLCAS